METNNQIWVMKYKDSDSEHAPWKRWLSIDEPSQFMIQKARENGFYWLKVVGKFNIESINSMPL